MPEAPLRRRRILLVEDDYFVADEMKSEFEAAGAEVVGPVGRLKDALLLATSAGPLDGAVLDINLVGEMAYPVADKLLSRGVPIVFATGYDCLAIPPVYADVPCCEKPVKPDDLLRALFR